MSRKNNSNSGNKSSSTTTEELLSKLIQKFDELELLQREVITAVRLIAEQEDVAVLPVADTTVVGTVPFRVGDLVQVTNRIRQPFGGLKRATKNSNRGVVVRITKRRIHVKLTDTGLIVQRDPLNVQHQE